MKVIHENEKQRNAANYGGDERAGASADTELAPRSPSEPTKVVLGDGNRSASNRSFSLRVNANTQPVGSCWQCETPVLISKAQPTHFASVPQRLHQHIYSTAAFHQLERASRVCGENEETSNTTADGAV